MSWIQTFSGRKFSLIDPQPEDVDIGDVIDALGKIVRFGGHCHGTYTVLQHSVHVAELCNQEFRFDGLMHDAPEAYYGDITRPMKIVLRELSNGRTDEWMARIDRVVSEALGYQWPTPEAVKYVDAIMLASEARDLMGPPPEPWVALPPPVTWTVEPWGGRQTYSRFVELYHKYKSTPHAAR
jgi:hypothetical protein